MNDRGCEELKTLNTRETSDSSMKICYIKRMELSSFGVYMEKEIYTLHWFDGFTVDGVALL